MAKLIEKIKSHGKTIVIVDHDLKIIMKLCKEITVLNFGQILAEGTATDLKNNQQVINAYIGTNHNDFAG